MLPSLCRDEIQGTMLSCSLALNMYAVAGFPGVITMFMVQISIKTVVISCLSK